MNRQPPDITNELIVIFGMLFIFCALESIFTNRGQYISWSIVFGIILAFLVRIRGKR